MRIQVMKNRDYLGVYNLWISTPGMGLNNLDDSKEGIKKYLKRNPKTCFIAKENDKIIGAILTGHDGRRGYIHHLAVDIRYRKKGIGSELVRTAIDALVKEDINKVAFVVFKNNKIGNTFWQRLGFTDRQDLIYRNKVINDKLVRNDI
jgi:ribosomal protein S18 acetylase RimI-like enzyme